MPALNDIYTFELHGTVSDSVFMNTFQFLLADYEPSPGANVFDAVGAAALATVAYELLIEDLIPWCKANVIWLGLNGRNLFNAAELLEYTFPVPYVGENAGAASPDFISPVLYSTRKVYGMHGGRKMLPPVAEELITGNDIVGGLVTSLATMANKWNTVSYQTTDAAGSLYTWAPVVVKRVKEETGNPRRPYTYRLPDVKVTAQYYLADNWAAKAQISTMNSRKQGRGS